MCGAVLNAEKDFMEAAKRNDVETMKTLGRGLNANAKDVVGLNSHTLYLHPSIQHHIISHKKAVNFCDYVKTCIKWIIN